MTWAWAITSQPDEEAVTSAACDALRSGMTPALVIASLDKWLAAHPEVTS